MVPVIPMILDLASVSTCPRTNITNLVLILIIVIALPNVPMKISNLASVSPHPRPIGPNGKSLEPHKAVSSSGEALSILFIFVIKTSLLLTSFLPLKVTQGNTFITQVALFQFLILQHCKKSAPTSIVIKMFRCTAGELPPDFHYYHHGVSRSFPRRGNWLRNVPGSGPAVYNVTTWRTHHQKQHGTQDLGRMDTIYTM